MSAEWCGVKPLKSDIGHYDYVAGAYEVPENYPMLVELTRLANVKYWTSRSAHKGQGGWVVLKATDAGNASAVTHASEHK